jgi:hypothetical protein
VKPITTGLEAMRIGIIEETMLSAESTGALARLIRWVVTAGGTVVLPMDSSNQTRGGLVDALGLDTRIKPTLRYGEIIRHSGFHLMASPSRHVQETLTGLGATGVQGVLLASNEFLISGHPFIPVLQVGNREQVDVDCRLEDEGEASTRSLLEKIVNTLQGGYSPQNVQFGIEAFQMSRGWEGVSL